MFDIYFNKEYGHLCEFVEPGQCKIFTCNTPEGLIQNMFIMRKVPWLVDNVQYYDIITPYGYGGPIIYNTTNTEKLVEEYKKQFENYCIENNIVCEFVRFHPIYRNWMDFSGVYNTVFSRHTVGTNLQDFVDPVRSEFSKSAKKELRKAIKNGVHCSIHPFPEDLTVFRQLYNETMDRNNADSKYYFPKEYYSILTSTLRKSVLEIQAHLDGSIIASEIYFIEGDIMHAHLLGSNELLLQTGGGIMLEATAANWGREHGYRYIHHGGGRTSSEEDSLYLYKRKFGKNTLFDFYMGKKVWNRDVYDKLVTIRKNSGIIIDPDYFPLYRG